MKDSTPATQGPPDSPEGDPDPFSASADGRPPAPLPWRLALAVIPFLILGVLLVLDACRTG